MKVIFRCDSSYSIGSGHLMRCLTLARMLEGEICFICRDLPGNINSLVTQNQFNLIELKRFDNYVIEQKMEEIAEIEFILKEQIPDIIVVDHYGLDHSWEVVAKKYCSKLLAIDDIGRLHCSDGILDQNYRKEVPANYIETSAKLFLGPKYCLLNKKFLDLEIKDRSFQDTKNILVFFGGSDLFSMTLRVLNLIKAFSQDIHWDVVLGQQSPDISKIRSVALEHKNIETHINVQNMHELMQKADLFLGAGGTTTWERAKLGLPSIVISIARNQEGICTSLADEKIINYLGRSQDVDDQQILGALKLYISDSSKRKVLSQRSLALQVSSHLDELVKFIKSS